MLLIIIKLIVQPATLEINKKICLQFIIRGLSLHTPDTVRTVAPPIIFMGWPDGANENLRVEHQIGLPCGNSDSAPDFWQTARLSAHCCPTEGDWNCHSSSNQRLSELKLVGSGGVLIEDDYVFYELIKFVCVCGGSSFRGPGGGQPAIFWAPLEAAIEDIL